ncbi:EAL domain-containing protein [uncultured Amaricoccus sp.]|uniref:EAL domain-containing protein n=1 Tax=uncultured Amaricoccus sp. TaxID=339341 RepID=UPI00262F9B4E|nr:EAL domain-containing protein [uncultured Amaricoccus sp.]
MEKLIQFPNMLSSIGDGAGRLEARARVRFNVAQALVQGRVAFHYQPVVRAANTRFPAFYEMLARVRMPNGQLLAAGSFLPMVADGEIGRAIDRLALATALRELARDPGLRLSVNISPLSMGDEEWLALLAAAARGGSGVLGRLIIEITEDAAIGHADQTIDFMNHVRRTGCAFALDDFGAGATGFRHFRDFRFDLVKIDGAFTQGVQRSPDSQVLVECLMTAARHFEMVTVAERVEAPADADWLRARGVDCFQGYLFGRPAARPEMPAEGDKDSRAAG